MSGTGPSLRAAFFGYDDALSMVGVPPLTEWWREHIGAWLTGYETGDQLELVGCVGRGAAKSTALYKLGSFFARFGPFAIPPGEVHYAIVLSRQRDEAAKGIQIISKWYGLLGISHRLAGDVIELTDMPRGLRVAAASVAAVSGWRAFFVGKDERSKWPANGVDELDAQEIDTSAAAMTATHPRAPLVSFGSAWGTFGGFYESIIEGTTAYRYVAGPTPTWVAAPHITKESTQRKERDLRRWSREYACEFQAGAMAAIDPEALRACVRALSSRASQLEGAEIIFDSNGGRHDFFVIFAVAWMLEYCDEPEFMMGDAVDLKTGQVTARQVVVIRDANGEMIPNPRWHPPIQRLYVRQITTLEGQVSATMSTGDVADLIAQIANKYGATRCHGDQYGAWSWQSELALRGLRFEEHAWGTGSASKSDAIIRLRQLIKDKLLVIDSCNGKEADALIKEAGTFQERITPSGALTFAARGSAFDDRIMTLLLTARCDAEGRLRGSPLKRHGATRTDFDETDFGFGG